MNTTTRPKITIEAVSPAEAEELMEEYRIGEAFEAEVLRSIFCDTQRILRILRILQGSAQPVTVFELRVQCELETGCEMSTPEVLRLMAVLEAAGVTVGEGRGHSATFEITPTYRAAFCTT